MNTPVSYSMAKLLDSKEVRFENWQGNIFVDGEEQPHMAHWYVGAKEILIRPTIADVVMWLYEKHGIWISPTHQHNQFFWGFGSYQTQEFKTPTEAYEAAFEHTLNKLI
jgi:hypothetical protein